MFLSTYVWPFLVYWVLLFVACYILVEFGQNYLYDETIRRMGLFVVVGSLILAAGLTWTRTSFDTMFTSDFPQTVLQAVLWFAVFCLVFRFQPWHAAAIGIVAMLLVSGIASLAVDSMLSPSNPAQVGVRTPSKPVRRPSGPPVGLPVPKAP